MDRRIVHWGLSGLLLTSVAMGATGTSKPAATSRKAEKPPQATPLSQSAPSIQWIYDLKSAQAQSLATGKPMLIVCGGPWCVYCKKLEKEVLGNPAIAKYITKTFIAVHLDSEKDQRAVQILEVKSLPTTVILSPEADLLGSIEGFVKPRDYATVLKQSVEFQKSLREDAGLALSRGKK